MPEGAWIYNADGSERFTPNTSNITILGTFDTGKSSGSFTNAMLTLGQPVVISAISLETTWGGPPPTITISGSTISWTFRINGSSSNRNHRVMYGVMA